MSAEPSNFERIRTAFQERKTQRDISPAVNNAQILRDYIRLSHEETPPLLMEIPPAMADEMLKRNVSNRPLNAAAVAEYEAYMSAREFYCNPADVLCFSDTGHLINGQHRLAASRQSGSTIKAWVKFGVPERLRAFIDRGRSFIPGDLFAVHGVKNAASMAATTPLVMGYYQGNLRTMLRGRTRGDLEKVYKAYLGYSRLQDSLPPGIAFSRTLKVAPRIATAFHYVTAQIDRAAADDFFARCCEGVGITDTDDAVLVLRKRLLQNAMNRSGQLDRAAIWVLIAKAWNAYRNKRPMGIIRFNPDEALPELV
jgi:hypothetical protein